MIEFIPHSYLCPPGMQDLVAYPHIIMSNTDLDAMKFFNDYVEYSKDKSLSNAERVSVSEFVYIALGSRVN